MLIALAPHAGSGSGLAAYKTKLIKEIIDEFVDQEFFGEKCTHSDDRHLTNLVLRSGHDVVFVPEAISYTSTPSTYRQFLKQQIRWRRGFFQEAIFGLTFLWRVKPLMFIEILVWDIALTFLSFGIVLLILFNAIVDPLFLLFGLLPSLTLLMIVRHLPLIIYAPRKILPLFYFTLFSHFVMYWQSIYAIFSLKKGSWITR